MIGREGGPGGRFLYDLLVLRKNLKVQRRRTRESNVQKKLHSMSYGI